VAIFPITGKGGGRWEKTLRKARGGKDREESASTRGSCLTRKRKEKGVEHSPRRRRQTEDLQSVKKEPLRVPQKKGRGWAGGGASKGGKACLNEEKAIFGNDTGYDTERGGG